jgi:hypothetical protein
VNLHLPCAQADVENDDKGRKRRQQAARQNDTEAARHMQPAKQKLFTGFRKSACERWK